MGIGLKMTSLFNTISGNNLTKQVGYIISISSNWYSDCYSFLIRIISYLKYSAITTVWLKFFWIIFIAGSSFRYFSILPLKTILPKIILGNGGGFGERWRHLGGSGKSDGRRGGGLKTPNFMWRHLWTLP